MPTEGPPLISSAWSGMGGAGSRPSGLRSGTASQIDLGAEYSANTDSFFNGCFFTKYILRPSESDAPRTHGDVS